MACRSSATGGPGHVRPPAQGAGARAPVEARLDSHLVLWRGVRKPCESAKRVAWWVPRREDVLERPAIERVAEVRLEMASRPFPKGMSILGSLQSAPRLCGTFIHIHVEYTLTYVCYHILYILYTVYSIFSEYSKSVAIHRLHVIRSGCGKMKGF